MLPGDPRSPAPRALRAGAFAGVSVTLAVGAHAVGGMPIGPSEACVALVAGVVLTRVAHTAADREVGLARLLAGMGVTQLVLHVALMLTGMAPHHQGSMGQLHMDGGPMHLGLPSGGRDLAMLLAHTLAAGLAGLWLRHGERAVWALARLAGGRGFTPRPLRLDVLGWPTPVSGESCRGRRRRGRELMALGLARRGPPACA